MLNKDAIYNRDLIRENLMCDANKQLGICEQLRQIYDSVFLLPESEIKENITEGLVTALIMAKKMGDRLTYYHKLTKDNTGVQGSNLMPLDQQALIKMRKRRMRDNKNIR